MNQPNFKDSANFGSTMDDHQAMFFFLQVVSIGVQRPLKRLIDTVKEYLLQK